MSTTSRACKDGSFTRRICLAVPSRLTPVKVSDRLLLSTTFPLNKLVPGGSCNASAVPPPCGLTINASWRLHSLVSATPESIQADEGVLRFHIRKVYARPLQRIHRSLRLGSHKNVNTAMAQRCNFIQRAAMERSTSSRTARSAELVSVTTSLS